MREVSKCSEEWLVSDYSFEVEEQYWFVRWTDEMKLFRERSDAAIRVMRRRLKGRHAIKINRGHREFDVPTRVPSTSTSMVVIIVNLDC